MSVADEIKKLQELQKEGTLSPAEFAQAKRDAIARGGGRTQNSLVRIVVLIASAMFGLALLAAFGGAAVWFTTRKAVDSPEGAISVLDIPDDRTRRTTEAIAAATGTLPSCERGKPPPGLLSMTHGGLASRLNRGDYLEQCRVPSSMSVKICVATNSGTTSDVTVSTGPSDPKIVDCLISTIKEMKLAPLPHPDVTRVSFDAR